MKIKNKLLISSFVFLSAFVVIVLGFVFGGCGLDQGFAQSRVEEHLKKEGKSIKKLTFDAERSSYCNVAFIYESGASKIYFSVINGGKLTWWDVEARGPI